MQSRIQQARARVEALRLALLSPSPEEIGSTLAGLEEAARCLETVEREVREGTCAPHEVRRELKFLKNDLRISARLIEHGLAFCNGWARMLGTGPSYSQAGDAVPAETVGTLSLRG